MLRMLMRSPKAKAINAGLHPPLAVCKLAQCPSSYPAVFSVLTLLLSAINLHSFWLRLVSCPSGRAPQFLYTVYDKIWS